ERTRIELAPDPMTRIELALDRGSLVAGSAHREISEVELELLAPREPIPAQLARLYELALALHAVAPLQIGTASKADLGYGLHTGVRAVARKAVPPALDPTDTAAQAFGTIARFCIGHLLDNQRSTL